MTELNKEEAFKAYDIWKKQYPKKFSLRCLFGFHDWRASPWRLDEEVLMYCKSCNQRAFLK